MGTEDVFKSLPRQKRAGFAFWGVAEEVGTPPAFIDQQLQAARTRSQDARGKEEKDVSSESAPHDMDDETSTNGAS